eukprot:m.476129 g.476129  ORF g.476129 m.476129 type:complete len:154 (+) comp20443_c0_seq1:921-1382(+)
MASDSKVFVIGVDASEDSRKAIDWTVDRLCSGDDSLHVVYCYQPLENYVGPDFVHAPSEEQQTQWAAAERKRFDECVAASKLASSKRPFTPHFIAGDPRDQILEVADKLSPTGVVVGSHGKGLFKQFLLGSVSSHLLHHSKHPVIVLPRAAST